MALSACSSSQVEEFDEEIPDAAVDELADAGTDMVPMEGELDGLPPSDIPPENVPVDPTFEAEASPYMEQPMDPLAEAPLDPAPTMAEAPATDFTVAAASSPPAVSYGSTTDYTVQGDDTLMKIAFEHYGDLYKWRKIFNENKDKISDPNNVPRGTVLKLENPGTPVVIERNGEKYLIKPGDTLGKISDEVYGSTHKWKRLWENNKQLIRNPNKIFAGFYLYYTMTPEDKQELERLRPSQQVPLAQSPEPARDVAAGTN